MKKLAWIAAVSFAGIAPLSAQAQTAAPAAAPAQASPAKVGDTIYDDAGAEVGKIESIANGTAVVFTGTNRASVAVTSFGTSPKGPTFGMTKAQLDEAAIKAAAAAQSDLRAKLTVGADVHGKNGATVAKIKSVDGENIVLTSAKGDVTVPITGIGTNEQGLYIGMTQAEFDAAVVASQAK
ncbi:MAG: hypothetical protein V4808_12775 [Pseudomonadota bacterium]